MAPEVAVVAQALFDHAMVGAQDGNPMGNPVGNPMGNPWKCQLKVCQFSSSKRLLHLISRE